MKYLMMIYANQETWAGFGPDDWATAIADQEAYNERYAATGELVGAFGLAGPEAAKVIRVRRGTRQVSDGPYLETKEYLASYYMLEVESEERALQIAADMPFASFRAVEVWPVMHESAADL